MQFLKILFWCLLAFVAAVFTFGNWTPCRSSCGAGWSPTVNLPLLLLVTFLVGLLPTLALSARGALAAAAAAATAERTLAELRVAGARAAGAAVEPIRCRPPRPRVRRRRSLMTNRIYVALDTPDLARAKAMAARVRHHVGGIKLGLEFFVRATAAPACARWPSSACRSSST